MQIVGIHCAHSSTFGKQQPLLNETACSLAAMTSAVELSVVSSVADSVQFYWDSLATKQCCGLRARAGSMWRVGTACSGTDSVGKVLLHLGRSSGWTFKHMFQLRM